MTEIGCTQNVGHYIWYNKGKTLTAVDPQMRLKFMFGAEPKVERGDFRGDFPQWKNPVDLTGEVFTFRNSRFRFNTQNQHIYMQNSTNVDLGHVNDVQFFPRGFASPRPSGGSPRYTEYNTDGRMITIEDIIPNFSPTTDTWKVSQPLDNSRPRVIWQTNEGTFSCEVPASAMAAFMSQSMPEVEKLQWPKLAEVDHDRSGSGAERKNASIDESNQSPQNGKRETSRKLIGIALLLLVSYGCFKLYGKMRTSRG